MKIEISDESSCEDSTSSLITVLHLDGTRAVEGVDYALWEGEYTKGVAIKDGIVVRNSRSTHANADNQKEYLVIRDGKGSGWQYCMAGFSRQVDRPTNVYRDVSEDVFQAILAAILVWGKPDAVAKMLARWASLERFQ